MTELESLLILNAIPGLGPVRIRRLIERFGSADKVLSATLSRVMEVEGIGRRISNEIRSWQKNFDLKKECLLIKKHNVRVLTINDSEYPPLLKEIYDPPVVLYIKGNILPEDKQAVAIVGARRASYYGVNTARRLARQLGNRGLTIISGLARGVDTAAHQGALSAKGRTIAVYGCGLDRIYPPENKKLVGEIIDNGAVVTEFPFGTAPHKENFPRRNRIISGLSLGVIVIEAGKYSGSLITARLATEQGREVFSVPGRIDAVTSQGTNVLIKHGAKPVLELEDILEELKYLLPDKKSIKSQPGAGGLEPEQIDKAGSTPQLKSGYGVNLDKAEEKIYKILNEEGTGVDELVDSTGLNVSDVWKKLVGLELKGLVKRLPGSRYVKTLITTDNDTDNH